MRKCTGNNWQEWGFDSIFDIECPHCSNLVEFFKDEISRHCIHCKGTVKNHRQDVGCNQWCSAASEHQRNLCSNYRKSKDRFAGRLSF
ncbi:MAG: hypothetical protein QNI92_15580 [Desulfobacterales bacterium]|nr:hypothetical protein [Desulfobacterales bacterium]